MPSSLTRWAFLAGAVYFLCMATAHFFSFKYPLLFVYWDTPFYAYQDKIISFSVIAYAGLFYLASRSREAATIASLVMVLTVIGLAAVNLSSDLALVLDPNQSTWAYWVQTALFASYAMVLVILTVRDRRA
jgi:ABC-type enterochelin transport system permease subunit